MNSAHLLHLLQEKGVDCSTWGKNGNKTVDDLALELEKGDSILMKSSIGIVRRTKVATADIFYHDQDGKTWKLKEEKQIMRDGRIRIRNHEHSISEKVRSGIGGKREKMLVGILRGIREEIKATLSNTNITYKGKRREISDGRSYPGLQTIYKLADFEVILPKEYYKPEGYTEEENGTTTYFIWQPYQSASPQSSAE